MNKIEKAILTELNEWDLSCSEEPTLKLELAKALGKVVKNCSIPAVVVSEERAELCDNPNCEGGIVDRDYYGHPIYCQVCESHN